MNLLRVTLALSWALFSAPASASDRLLTNLHLIDGTGGPARHVDRLWIVDGRIAAIDDPGFEGPGAGAPAETLDLDGAWVIPGLIDTHVHVARFPDARAEAQRILKLALTGGVTAVRDLGGDTRPLAELARGRSRGEWAGALAVFAAMVAGPAVFEAPQIGSLAGGYRPGQAPWGQAVGMDSAWPVVVGVARGAGARGLKLYGNLDADQVRALTAEAHRQGLLAWAHATTFPAGPLDLVEAGVDSLCHAPYLVWAAVDEIPDDYSARTSAPWSEVAPDHPRIRALLKAMAERQISLDATLYVFERMKDFSPQVKADWTAEASAWGAQVTALAHAMGVPVTTGTDWFEPREPERLPHTHDELALLVEQAGFSPSEAIVAATRNGARALAEQEVRGTLEVGKLADLVVLEADPLADIRHTRRIRWVMQEGEIVDR